MDKAVMSVRMQKWVEVLEAANASGLTKTEWCAQNGIRSRQFFYWQKRIRDYLLEQHPELGLSTSENRIREANAQMLAFLPSFYELTPRERSPDVLPFLEETMCAFSTMIRIGKYEVYVGDSSSEKTLSTILSVIQHA